MGFSSASTTAPTTGFYISSSCASWQSGQALIDSDSHRGPLHHKDDLTSSVIVTPRLAMSAGFSSEATWRHSMLIERIVSTRFSTNIGSFLNGLDFIHAIAHLESDQPYNGMLNKLNSVCAYLSPLLLSKLPPIQLWV